MQQSKDDIKPREPNENNSYSLGLHSVRQGRVSGWPAIGGAVREDQARINKSRSWLMEN